MERELESIRQDSEEGSTVEEHQFVTFIIGEEMYGVSAVKVQEIIGLSPITYVPNSLPYMKGVINLRGSVVPVIDMRLKFNLSEREYDSTTVIIIVEVRNRLVGMIVDAVSDVLNIPIHSLQDTPHFSARIETDFIDSIGQFENKLIIVLNTDRILSVEELNSLDQDVVQ